MSLPALSQHLPRLAAALHGVEFALVFGSAASGRLRGDSDVDLAVRYPAPVDAASWILLTGELSEIVQRQVDLVDLRRAGPIVSMQVLSTGIPLLVNDQQAFEQFRMYTPSSYFDFKRSRQTIEQALAAGARP